jgi:hypothetical protein
MRLFIIGPRILGVRPGVSIGPEDFRKRAWRRPGPLWRGELAPRPTLALMAIVFCGLFAFVVSH